MMRVWASQHAVFAKWFCLPDCLRPANMKAGIATTLTSIPTIMPSPLDNYLRAYRKKSGLTQKELAFLVGRDVASIHRHEQKHGLPTLRTALAYCLILGVPIDKLFAGIHRRVGIKLTRRIAQLRADVLPQGRGDLVKRLTETRLRWLGEKRRVRNRQAIE